jgi:hypothetical protein
MINGVEYPHTPLIGYLSDPEKIVVGNYDLEVIDVYQQPELTEGQKIVAVPTLVRILPLPLQQPRTKPTHFSRGM